MMEQAITFKAPDTSTKESWAARASNLFGADVNGNLVSSEIFAAHFSAKPILVFKPVPTAVPPKANMCNLGRVSLIRSIPKQICWQ